MTDAQIIFAAGGLSKWRSHFTPRTILHLGVCGDPILKAPYSAVRRTLALSGILPAPNPARNALDHARDSAFAETLESP
jgi:hypothetical protein